MAPPPVERKNSSSGVWTVTDVDQHNPSVNSDNSTGSTSGSWVIKPASANTPPPPPKTNGHSSIQSPVKKSLTPTTPHTNGSKGPDLSRSDGYEQIAQVMIFVTNALIYFEVFYLKIFNNLRYCFLQRGDLKGSATTTVRTVVDEGAFAKSLATDTPRKRANNGSSSNGRGESGISICSFFLSLDCRFYFFSDVVPYQATLMMMTSMTPTLIVAAPKR